MQLVFELAVNCPQLLLSVLTPLQEMMEVSVIRFSLLLIITCLAVAFLRCNIAHPVLSLVNHR
jgi:hypothetical protein